MQKGIMGYFEKIEDPRIERKKLHSISEILFLILCCSLCGITDYVHMEDFGKARIDWFRRYYQYGHGIPSHDTLGRVMSILSPSLFKECFLGWVKSLKPIKGDTISIDGKALRHSFNDGDPKSAIYMVSAWGSKTGLVLGQDKVENKSNEITAIPKLLEMLDIEGSIITIDAMGCQYEIAEKINIKGGEYIFALKGNQGNLSDDVKLLFADKELVKNSNPSIHETTDGDHGRVEIRKCTVLSDTEWLRKRHKNWSSVQSIIQIESSREIKNKISQETRYYVSSCCDDANIMLKNIRAHWEIENKLHWVLDVQFDEDKSRIRKDHSPENMAIIRHSVLNMINIYRQNTKKISVKRVHNLAAWSDLERQKLIFQQYF